MRDFDDEVHKVAAHGGEPIVVGHLGEGLFLGDLFGRPGATNLGVCVVAGQSWVDDQPQPASRPPRLRSRSDPDLSSVAR
jgi:hypothetical protein